MTWPQFVHMIIQKKQLVRKIEFHEMEVDENVHNFRLRNDESGPAINKCTSTPTLIEWLL